jgi:hypothetical protein
MMPRAIATTVVAVRNVTKKPPSAAHSPHMSAIRVPNIPKSTAMIPTRKAVLRRKLGIRRRDDTAPTTFSRKLPRPHHQSHHLRPAKNATERPPTMQTGMK